MDAWRLSVRLGEANGQRKDDQRSDYFQLAELKMGSRV